jgi:ferric-dicitrate binding protein FerR (iron transport regulator)
MAFQFEFVGFRRACSVAAIASLGLSLVLAVPASGQTACTWTTIQDPLRQIITCGPALRVEREAGSSVTLIEGRNGSVPRTIELRGGAAFIEVTPGSAATQIRAPHAIAAVRGTTYIVDAGPAATSVFVIEGRVEVRKPEGGQSVMLNSGDGVDVTTDAPLEVVAWGAGRVADLLARFAR